ncbi:MAG: LuxR C-terminal-related transcriptional regulator [Coriobacteriia bacterium]|nr:LuxR C-terminal-related transcriptional regulator [Coriobacteriia bacterium]
MSYLSSKTAPPLLPSRIVSLSRRRVDLRQAYEKRLTMVVSIAGAGKTTCLGQMYQQAQNSGLKAFWLTLDQSDNEPVRFWSSFFATLEELGITLPDSLLASLIKNPQARINVLKEAMGQIASAQTSILLVLDDYQVIDSKAINEGLIFWVEHMPANMHIALASRRIPAFQLSRLRGQDQLFEIHSSELFFDFSATVSFVRHVKGISASDDAIRELYELTNGWTAGLQIVLSEHLKGEAVAGASLVSPKAARHLREYIAEEILYQLDSSQREFLFSIALLNRFSIDLCQELTSLQQSKQNVDSLVQSGLFISQLDEAGEWYHFHPLFLEVLRHQLKSIKPSVIRELYLRASEWMEQQGFLDEAIEYALLAKDDDRVIRLFERTLLEAFNKLDGEWFVLNESKQRVWLQSLSKERYKESLPYLLLNAWSNFVASRPQESMTYLQLVNENLEQMCSDKNDPIIPLGVKEIVVTIEAGNANMAGDYRHAIMLSRNSLDHMQGGSVWFKVTLLCLLGQALARVGETDESLRIYYQAKSVATAFGGRQLEQFCSYEIGKQHYQQGHLGLAADIWQRAISSYEGAGSLEFFSMGLLYLGLGNLNTFRGDIDDAEFYLEKARSILPQSNNLYCHLELQVALAYYYEAQGRHIEALNIIAAASELAISSYSEVIRRNSAWETFVCYAKIALTSGDSYTASTALATLNEYIVADDSYYRLQALLVYAGFLKELGSTEETLKVLADVNVDAQRTGYLGIAIEAMTMRAHCLSSLGQLDAATLELMLALDAAGEGGYLRPFLVGSTVVGELLYRILHERKGQSGLLKKRRALCRHILNARQKQNREAESDLLKSRVNLSRREEDILSLLEQGLTKQEISEKLHVSINTVKTHVKNIYRKLEVHDRAAAAQVANRNAKQIHPLISPPG